MAISSTKSLSFISLLLITVASSSKTTTTTFIKTQCNSTSFPSLCVSSLSKYSSSLHQQSLLQLAQIATNLSLSNLKSTATQTAAVYKKTKTTTKTAKALRDCMDLLKDAIENTQYSISQLKGLSDDAGAEKNAWGLAKAQTYMSAVLTKEETCTDGLKEMGAKVKEVSGGVAMAKKYTSNALALVNSLRNTYY